MTFCRLILLTFAVSITFSGLSQDTITYISGLTTEGEITSVSDSQIKYLQTKKGKKTEKFLDRYSIYSIKYADGREEVLYKQDTAVGFYFTPTEMQHYIFGQQDATNNFKTGKHFLMGAGISMAGGFLLGGSFLVIPVPFVSTMITGLPSPKIDPTTTRNPKLIENPAYVMGYKDRAKSRKLTAGLKGSLVGIVLGIGLYAIVVGY